MPYKPQKPIAAIVNPSHPARFTGVRGLWRAAVDLKELMERKRQSDRAFLRHHAITASRFRFDFAGRIRLSIISRSIFALPGARVFASLLK